MFQSDNLLSRVLTKVFDLCLLNILFLITSLPIFTIGVSLSALYTVTLAMSKNEESPVFKMYFRMWKQNFKKGMIAGLVLLGIVALLIFDMWIWWNSRISYRMFFMIATLVLLSLVIMVSNWVFPLTAKFENSVKNMFKNAMIFSMRYAIVSFCMGIVMVGYMALILKYFVVVLPLFFLFGVILLVYPWTLYVNLRFERYLNEQKERESCSERH
ncbi:MAG TPA: DUF624 domain-containing protein [Candidatus Fimimorpha faecalis]|uniref:DUF624 domain-containing protein n=1 Tax=Candidatus Fimimorpha faecalis TaxID=2840824 RepID=A0A9D1JDF7_9FIRM|nr:DUF624 domain-containing protein [Candidatus Fimimorpha faecalis]